MTNKSTRRQGRRRALLLGLAGSGIAFLAMTGAPTIATAAPSGTSSPRAGVASVVPDRIVPVRARRGRLGGHSPAPSCDGKLVILSGLTASSTTLPTGSAVSLTATMTCDIGSSMYWVQIFDTTTGTLVGSCGTGTSCGVKISQSAASTHDYIAYLGLYGSTYPPASISEKSLNVYVTWEAPPNSFAVSLSGPADVGYGQGPATYTASTTQNVAATPYWIEIFDETTNTLLGDCGSGTQCSVSFTPAFTGDDLVAFVSGLSSTLPPATTQASSGVLTTVQERASR